MPEFEVFGTDQEIDTSDPTGSIMTILYVIAGAAVLFMVLPIGQQLGSWLNNTISGLLGMDVGDADTGPIQFGSVE